jgi:hypothetical protein
MADAQLIEEVADKIEDVAEATRRLYPRDISFFLIGAGVGAALGFGLAYRVAESRMKTKYQGLAINEISKMREHYFQKAKAAEPKPPIVEAVKERYSEVELQAIKEANEKFPAEEEEVGALEEMEEIAGWDYKYETSHRSQNTPYIIHFDEFTENEPEHDQVSYIYYEGDGALSDTRDTTVDNIDMIVGLKNLRRWGHGSHDPNIVHIRNERLHMDMEVLRDPGSFADTQPGTIRHSADRRRRPKRRFDDEDFR